MGYKDLQRITRNGLLGLGLAFVTALPIAAQPNTNNRNDRTDNTTTTTTRVVERDNGTDWGWLGLLGLLGLAGLLPKKRKVEVEQFRDTHADRPGQTGSSKGTTR